MVTSWPNSKGHDPGLDKTCLLSLPGGRGQCFCFGAGDGGMLGLPPTVGLPELVDPNRSLFSAPTEEARVRKASFLDVTYKTSMALVRSFFLNKNQIDIRSGH